MNLAELSLGQVPPRMAGPASGRRRNPEARCGPQINGAQAGLNRARARALCRALGRAWSGYGLEAGQAQICGLAG